LRRLELALFVSANALLLLAVYGLFR